MFSGEDKAKKWEKRVSVTSGASIGVNKLGKKSHIRVTILQNAVSTKCALLEVLFTSLVVVELIAGLMICMNSILRQLHGQNYLYQIRLKGAEELPSNLLHLAILYML